MKTVQQCSVPGCTAQISAQGRKMHMTKHPGVLLSTAFPVLPSASAEAQKSTEPVLSTGGKVLPSASAEAQKSTEPVLSAQLAEAKVLINKQDQRIDVQDKSLIEKDAQIAALKEELEDDKARLAEIPMTIGDFSAEEKAAYFVEFLKNLSPDNKAKLAEETGFGIVQPVTSEATGGLTGPVIVQQPAAAPAAMAEGVQKKVVLVFNGQPIGTITTTKKES